jgi:hypothetical protein
VGGPHTISATDPVSSSEAPRLEFKSNNADPGRIGTLISALANGATLVDRPYMEGGEAAFKLRKRSMDSDPIYGLEKMCAKIRSLFCWISSDE